MTVRQGGSYVKKSPDAKPELVERTAPAPHPNRQAPATLAPLPAPEPVETTDEKGDATPFKSTPKAKAKETS